MNDAIEHIQIPKLFILIQNSCHSNVSASNRYLNWAVRLDLGKNLLHKLEVGRMNLVSINPGLLSILRLCALK